MKNILVDLPIKIYKESNSNEHWAKKSRRHKLQKQAIHAYFNSAGINVVLPCKVTLTRIAPRALDSHDNLAMSMKWISDAIAEFITNDYIPGRADSNSQITWDYKQQKGKPKEYALKIAITEYES